VFPPEVAVRDAAPLSVLCEERGERFGITLTQRLGCGAKLIDHGRKYGSWPTRRTSRGSSGCSRWRRRFGRDD
jgi:hypothetical protein